MRRQREKRIIEGQEMWRCPHCNQWFPHDGFYKDKRTPYGIKSHCKQCHLEISRATRDPDNTRRINREHMRCARARDPEKFRERECIASRKARQNWNERMEARRQLNYAVQRGEIQRPDKCSRCGSTKGIMNGHHGDYSKPLETEWLCDECHGIERRLGVALQMGGA